MPTIKLTQIAVDRLKPPASGRVEYWDSTLPGFGLRVAAARPGREARKTWQAMYRVRGKLIRQSIGTLSTIPKVDDARETARESMLKAQQGLHPVEERRRAEADKTRRIEIETARRRDTVSAILDRYVSEHGAKRWRPDTCKEITRCFDVDIKPVLGTLPIRDVTRRDVRELIEGIVSRGRAPHAHHVLAYLRPAFGWAIGKEIIEGNPAVGIGDPDPRKREARTRDRYLDDGEIRSFWLGCDKLGWPFGPLFQLLLLTGQRRDELANATWREFGLDKGLWTLPGERAKNAKAHLVHLAPLAVEILDALPRIGSAGYIFTTTGTSPVSGFGRARERLAAAMLEPGTEEPVEAFTLHDLRRSAATGMAAIGVAHHVLDRILNHTAGKISGVGAIYNRFEYLSERKAALEAWARHVESLVRPSGAGNVVGIRGRRARA